MEFSSQLVRCRKQKGLSQEELAGRLGVSRQAVSKWETGEALPDLQKAFLLSEALGVGLDQLCKGSAEAEPPQQEKAAAARGRCSLRTLLACLLCFAAGIWLGIRQPAKPVETDGAAALPDTISVDGVSFSTFGGALSYRFVPSVVGEDYTYRITFTGAEGGPRSFEVSCDGGLCSGTAELPERDVYDVTVRIENEKEGRAVLAARDLSFSISQSEAVWS